MIRFYLYEYDKDAADFLGNDLSKYIATAPIDKQDITQQLDETTLTLLATPFKEAFSPSKKMIVQVGDDIVEGGVKQFVVFQTLHRVVKSDLVTKMVLKGETLYRHDLTLIEPSVIAQHRIVDNIATSYKLKDVTLDVTNYDIDYSEPASTLPENAFFVVPRPAVNWVYHSQLIRLYDQPKVYVVGTPGTLSDKKNIPWDNVGKTDGSGATEDGNGQKVVTISLAPYVYQVWANDTWDNYIGTLSMEITIVDSLGTTIAHTTIVTDSELISPFANILAAKRYGWIFFNDAPEYVPGETGVPLYPHYTPYSDTVSGVQWDMDNRMDITFTASHDVEYTLKIKPYKVTQNTYRDLVAQAFTSTTNEFSWIQASRALPPKSETTIQPISTYEYEGTFVFIKSQQEVFLESGNPYSAYSLISKAIYNSTVYKKQSPVLIDGDLVGVPVGDVNAQGCDVSFYIDKNYENLLRGTTVVENFFHQKNLWEVLVEAGNYIHAIPELRFGKDDRYEITFNRLGETEVYSDEHQPTTIMNFRGIDEYICETTSYITNLVQLGGSVTEITAAKNDDESCLTSNNTERILTSAPIIELLKMEVMRVSGGENGEYTNLLGSTPPVLSFPLNEWKDMTPFVFEKAVYDTLSTSVEQPTNKSFALYYTLYSPMIQGGQFRAPRKNNDAHADYAIKKVLFAALIGSNPAYATIDSYVNNGYKIFTRFAINDFVFRITYRTFSNARISNMRPDLKKYLLLSANDALPMHTQISNQQDVLVDSRKLGQKMYGVLVRTGNLEYTETIWVRTPYEIPLKGQLKQIEGELYYVATVKSSYYPNHIDAEVTYSRDYNELTKVIGIPSEPRFYEISERSIVDRTVSINDVIMISADGDNINVTDKPLTNMEVIVDRIFKQKDASEPPVYAITTFKGDADTPQPASYLGLPSHHIDIYTPVNEYVCGSTRTFHWEMKDNFSAGDMIVDPDAGEEYSNTDVDTANNAYTATKATRYTDRFGKAALFDFYLLRDDHSGWGSGTTLQDIIKALPNSPYKSIRAYNSLSGLDGGLWLWASVQSGDVEVFSTNVNKMVMAPQVTAPVTDEKLGIARVTAYMKANEKGLALIKDSRERIIFDLNQNVIFGDDTFIYSPFLWEPKEKDCRLAILSKHVNKLSNGYINAEDVIATYSYGSPRWWLDTVQDAGGFVDEPALNAPISDHYVLYIDGAQNIIDTTVKGIAFLFDYSVGDVRHKFAFARNFPENFSTAQKRAPLYIGYPQKSVFTH